MPYTSQAEMIELFGQDEILTLTNLGNPLPYLSVDSTRLAAAIEYAEAFINSYLSGRYALPLATVPIVLSGKAADIARYHLDSRDVREDVRQRFEDAVQWLKLVADGTIDLGLPANQAPEDTVNPVFYTAPKPVFSRDPDNFLSRF